MISLPMNPLVFEGGCQTTYKICAFEAVMRANGPKIYTLAVGLSGGNLAEGQDLAQDTFVKAFKHYSEFRGDAQVSTWLYRICVNLWKDRVRRNQRRARRGWLAIQVPEWPEQPEPAMQEPALDRSLERSEEQNRLQAALSQLEPEERALLLWKDMERCSYEEIGKFLTIPVGTVKSRLARARMKLQRAYFEK